MSQRITPADLLNTASPPQASAKSVSDLVREGKERAIRGLDNKILLNQCKQYLPLIQNLAYQDIEDPHAFVEKAVAEAQVLASKVADLMGVDLNDPSQGWVAGSLRETAAQVVGNHYRAAKYQGARAFDADTYVSGVAAALEANKVAPDNTPFPNITDRLSIQLSLSKALIPVIKELDMFETFVVTGNPSFKLDRSTLVKEFTQILNQASDEAVESMGVEGQGARIAKQAMLNHAGALLASSVAYVGDRIVDGLADAPKELKADLYQIADINKDAVIDRFADQFANFIEVVCEPEMPKQTATVRPRM